jgi:hypothetical protein
MRHPPWAELLFAALSVGAALYVIARGPLQRRMSMRQLGALHQWDGCHIENGHMVCPV